MPRQLERTWIHLHELPSAFSTGMNFRPACGISGNHLGQPRFSDLFDHFLHPSHVDVLNLQCQPLILTANHKPDKHQCQQALSGFLRRAQNFQAVSIGLLRKSEYHFAFKIA
jgi:hypothetical protein